MATAPEMMDATTHTRRADYALRLRRRVGGAVILVVAAVLISGIAIATPWGQGVDTMMMEALSWHLDILHGWEPLARTVISLFGIALGSLAIGLFCSCTPPPFAGGAGFVGCSCVESGDSGVEVDACSP